MVSHYDGATNRWLPVFQDDNIRDASYLAEWEHFIDCVEKGAIPIVPGEDGLNVLHVVAAARKSSVTGQKIWIADELR